MARQISSPARDAFSLTDMSRSRLLVCVAAFCAALWTIIALTL